MLAPNDSGSITMRNLVQFVGLVYFLFSIFLLTLGLVQAGNSASWSTSGVSFESFSLLLHGGGSLLALVIHFLLTGSLIVVSLGLMTFVSRAWVPAMVLSVIIPGWLLITAKFGLPVALGAVVGILILLLGRGLFVGASGESEKNP